jgi:pimeloyl-ACP methyl ester carboxylesterase
MLHGVTGHARTWDDESTLWPPATACWRWTSAGHGDTDPAPDADYSDAALLADLEAFVAALGLGRISIVALSLGGRVAINYAGTIPPTSTGW